MLDIRTLMGKDDSDHAGSKRSGAKVMSAQNFDVLKKALQTVTVNNSKMRQFTYAEYIVIKYCRTFICLVNNHYFINITMS